MTRTSRLTPRAEQMFALVEKYLTSGLTQKAFCQQESITYSTFHWWVHQYRHRQRPQTKSKKSKASEFIALQPTFSKNSPVPSQPTCTIEYPSGIVVHLFGAVDAPLLSALLQAQAG